MKWTDLHVHSTFSDGQMSIPQLVDFYGSRGFAAIAITDHVCENNTVLGLAARWLDYTLTRETFDYYLKIIEIEGRRAWNQYKMRVIPGIEISKNSLLNSRSAHILGLGVREWIEPELDIFSVCDKIHAVGGITIAAHPVSTGRLELQALHLWDQRFDLHRHIDAWEVASGAEIFSAVAQSGLPIVASSDLHRAQQVFSYKTLFAHGNEEQDFLQLILQQDLEIGFYKGDLNHLSCSMGQSRIGTTPLGPSR